MNQTQDGIATPAQAQFLTDINSGLAPNVESEFAKSLLESCRALSMRAAKVGKSFRKDLLCTRALATKETPDMHDETDGTPNGGKIP
jgi:hypothetical protein